jgi:hypothetical protein
MAAKPLQIAGLRELRRSLAELGPEAAKELRLLLREGAVLVADKAREFAPYAEKRPSSKERRHLRDLIKAGTAGPAAIVRDPLPYANLIHWGGNVPSKRSLSSRPKRHFEGTLFLTRALEEKEAELLAEIPRRIEELAQENGWR